MTIAIPIDQPIYVRPTMHRFARLAVRTVCVVCGLVLLASVLMRADHLTTREVAKAQKQEAQVAVDRTPNFGRIIVDGDGKIISWNRGMRDATGFSADQMIGKQIATLIAPEAEDSPAARALLTGGSADGNLMLRRAGSKTSTVLIKAKVNTASDFRYVIAEGVGQLNSL